MLTVETWHRHVSLPIPETLLVLSAEQRAAKIPPNILIKPLAGKSATKNLCGAPIVSVSASAARQPLRTAPSMVAGHSVAVQSPARNSRGHGVLAWGRYWSNPGRTEYVA